MPDDKLVAQLTKKIDVKITQRQKILAKLTPIDQEINRLEKARSALTSNSSFNGTRGRYRSNKKAIVFDYISTHPMRRRGEIERETGQRDIAYVLSQLREDGRVVRDTDNLYHAPKEIK